MNNKIIEKFYHSFSNGDVKEMVSCYHKDIVFSDPVFGKLEGKRAVSMWEMLLSKRSESTQITYDHIQSAQDEGSAIWTAKYTYGKTKRKVTNVVHASFTFKDGKIIEHTDVFDLWKWSQQALGIPGYLLGWTSFMKNKIQKTTKEQLKAFMSSK